MFQANIKKIISALFVIVLCPSAFAGYLEDFFNFDSATYTRNPLYIGGTIGYGNTNWGGLVDPNGETDGSDITTPISASDDGAVWGLFAGYEFSPHFALEGTFQHYPTSDIVFSQSSIYAPNPNSEYDFESETKAYTLITKFMVPILHTGIRVFGDMGPAYMYRTDVFADTGHWAATFGGGLNYDITPHLLAEVNFVYITGDGKATTQPVLAYMPFLYSANFGLALRLGRETEAPPIISDQPNPDDPDTLPVLMHD